MTRHDRFRYTFQEKRAVPHTAERRMVSLSKSCILPLYNRGASFAKKVM